MTEVHTEKRNFTRVEMALPVEVHQGGSVWHQRLIDISLTGVATDQPDVWDAQYNEPFTLKYFSHAAYDDYPVVGVTWKQAKAFCNWRTGLKADMGSLDQRATSSMPPRHQG